MSQIGKEWGAQFSRGQCCRADCKTLYYCIQLDYTTSGQANSLVTMPSMLGISIFAWSSHQRNGLGSDHIFNALRYRFRYFLTLPTTQHY